MRARLGYSSAGCIVGRIGHHTDSGIRDFIFQVQAWRLRRFLLVAPSGETVRETLRETSHETVHETVKMRRFGFSRSFCFIRASFLLLLFLLLLCYYKVCWAVLRHIYCERRLVNNKTTMPCGTWNLTTPTPPPPRPTRATAVTPTPTCFWRWPRRLRTLAQVGMYAARSWENHDLLHQCTEVEQDAHWWHVLSSLGIPFDNRG